MPLYNSEWKKFLVLTPCKHWSIFAYLHRLQSSFIWLNFLKGRSQSQIHPVMSRYNSPGFSTLRIGFKGRLFHGMIPTHFTALKPWKTYAREIWHLGSFTSAVPYRNRDWCTTPAKCHSRNARICKSDWMRKYKQYQSNTTGKWPMNNKLIFSASKLKWNVKNHSRENCWKDSFKIGWIQTLFLWMLSSIHRNKGWIQPLYKRALKTYQNKLTYLFEF